MGKIRDLSNSALLGLYLALVSIELSFTYNEKAII